MMAANEFGMKARIVTSEANEDQGSTPPIGYS